MEEQSESLTVPLYGHHRLSFGQHSLHNELFSSIYVEFIVFATYFFIYTLIEPENLRKSSSITSAVWKRMLKYQKQQAELAPEAMAHLWDTHLESQLQVIAWPLLNPTQLSAFRQCDPIWLQINYICAPWESQACIVHKQ